MNLNEHVNAALEAWIRLTGLEMKNQCRQPWSSWDIETKTKELTESRTLDPSGLTTLMLLQDNIQRYLKDFSVTGQQWLFERSLVDEHLAPAKTIHDLYNVPEASCLVKEFHDNILQAASFYEFTRLEDLYTLLQQSTKLAILRRDALRSMVTLEEHVFLQGGRGTSPPQYNPDIMEFWNVNSILAAMRWQTPQGISLCMIRHPDPSEILLSYFVFAIKNGETFVILTDRPKESFPGQSKNVRHKASIRDFCWRTEMNWFPYDLLDLEVVANDRDQIETIFAKQRKELVPINTHAVAIRNLKDLAPEEFIWTILMFDQIRDKYWKQPPQEKELSYTGQMIPQPQALVGAQGLVRYTPLTTELITLEKLAKNEENQWWDTSTGFSQWMIDRYQERVPQEVLNVVGNPALQLPAATLELTTPRARAFFDKPESPLQALSPTHFGTKKVLEKDRMWIARVNQMHVIQALAEKEYETLYNEIKQWVLDRLESNREELLNACVKGSLLLPKWSGNLPVKPETFEIVNHVKSYTINEKHYDPLYPKILFGKNSEYAWCCADRGNKASVFYSITPTCPQAVALLCRVDLADMPWPLQHWYHEYPYQGNYITDRIAPEDSILQNPWIPKSSGKGLHLSIGVAFSKRALKKRQIALGISEKS